MRTESRELLAVGIFGCKSSIGDRIETLLRRGRSFSPSASATGIAASAVVLGGLMRGDAIVPRWIAFAQQTLAPAFEVASIRPNRSGSADSIVNLPETGRLVVTNATLKTLIRNAWGIQNDQVAGGPPWLDSGRYDIQAKTAGPIREDQEGPLMQNLLADRFKLTLRREMKEYALYELVAAKTGLKLKESRADCAALAREDRGGGQRRAQCGAWFSNDTQLTGTKISMLQFAEGLSNFLDLPVIDKTGFAQNFDVHVEWTPDDRGTAPAGPPGDAAGPGIFTAVQEQLGLKLQSAKGPVETLVIDHVEKPDAN